MIQLQYLNRLYDYRDYKEALGDGGICIKHKGKQWLKKDTEQTNAYQNSRMQQQ